MSVPYRWDGEGQQTVYSNVNGKNEVYAAGTFSKYKVVTGVIYYYNDKNEIRRVDKYKDGVIIPSQFVFG